MTTVARAFHHLASLTDDVGIFEHTDHHMVRSAEGYCVDDVARALLVCLEDPSGPSEDVERITAVAFDFLLTSLTADGLVRNRCSIEGHWDEVGSVEDCWGRFVWAMGTAAACAPTAAMRAAALTAFDAAARHRSPHRRTLAFGALGAAAVLEAYPDHDSARRFLEFAQRSLIARDADACWAWPEVRLSYANGVIPEAMLAIGQALGREWMTRAGLDLLRWLVAHETNGDHLSVTPSTGARAGTPRPWFDQQPIELAALAGACARAFTSTAEAEWMVTLERAANWFEGHNDLGCSMIDATTGGAYDGLTPSGANLNHGAESTLALIATLQHTLRCRNIGQDA